MENLIGEVVLGIFAAIAAWKSRKAEQHTRPNGTSKNLTTLYEDLLSGQEANTRKLDDVLDWQVGHDRRHRQETTYWMPRTGDER